MKRSVTGPGTAGDEASNATAAITSARQPRREKGIELTPHQREVFEHTGRLLAEVPACGWSRQRVARSGLAPHAHAGVFELCLIRSGSVEWWVQQATYALGAGDVFVTWPGERHGGVGAVVHPCELYWLQVRFPKRGLAGLTRAATRALRHDLTHLPQRLVPASPELQRTFVDFIGEHRGRQPHAAVRARALLYALLTLLVREAGGPRASRRSEAVRRALEWIERRADEPFTVGELAADVGVSTVRLQSLFRSELGCPVGVYRTRLRVSRAKRLLQRTEMPITQLAHALGFASAQHFATVFRRFVGVPPHAYRRFVIAGRAAPS
jgi:AraC-like DNA-binding protein